MGISSRRPARQPSAIEVSTVSAFPSWFSAGGKPKPRRSNPPPDLPIRCSSPASGAWPLSAWIQVERMSSGVQRASPSVGQTRKPRRSASVCLATARSRAVSRARLIASDPREGVALELGLEEGAAELAPEPAHLAEAHGAENLEELVPPRCCEVHDPLRRPAWIEPWQPHPARAAVARLSLEAFLQRDADGDVEGAGVEAADDGLREVLGASDAAAPEQRHLLPHAGLDELPVGAPDGVAKEPRGGAAVIVGDEVDDACAVPDDPEHVRFRWNADRDERSREAADRLGEPHRIPAVELEHPRMRVEIVHGPPLGRREDWHDVRTTEGGIHRPPRGDEGERVEPQRRVGEGVEELGRFGRARREIEEKRELDREEARDRALGLGRRVEAEPRRERTDVDVGTDRLASVNSVARRTDDLGHVGPDAVPSFATEPPPVPGAAHRDATGAGLVEDGVDVVGSHERAAGALAFRVRVDLHHFWILDGAAQTADAQPLPWREAAKRPREDSVHARSAQDDAQVRPVLEELPEEEAGERQLPHFDAKPWWPRDEIRGGNALEVVARIRGSHRRRLLDHLLKTRSLRNHAQPRANASGSSFTIRTRSSGSREPEHRTENGAQGRVERTPDLAAGP